MSNQVEALREAHAFKPIEGHTPGPWEWGDGWKTEGIDLSDWSTFDKYEDMQLFGDRGIEIIPIRIDHHLPEWDCTDDATPPLPADRKLIAAAPDLQRHLATALQFMEQQHATLLETRRRLKQNGLPTYEIDYLITTYEEATK